MEHPPESRPAQQQRFDTAPNGRSHEQVSQNVPTAAAVVRSLCRVPSIPRSPLCACAPVSLLGGSIALTFCERFVLHDNFTLRLGPFLTQRVVVMLQYATAMNGGSGRHGSDLSRLMQICGEMRHTRTRGCSERQGGTAGCPAASSVRSALR